MSEKNFLTLMNCFNELFFIRKKYFLGFFFLVSGKIFFRLSPPPPRSPIPRASSVSQGNDSGHPPKQKGLVTPLLRDFN
jgi:hypothetical protein